MDNQSPGLNFSLGNFLGASDLDVKRVDIVAGASSAFYGPGAFNGVINMETKDPFTFPGLSFQTKFGERNLNEMSFRWADVLNNKEGEAVVGFKLNYFSFHAYDWEATNYSPVDGSLSGESNAGRFDAVNIYGDEYSSLFDFSDDNSTNARGLGTFYRTGYKEIDLVDYDTENQKLGFTTHIRLRPEQTYESPELILAHSMGGGTTVYQGDNRFSLRDIEFYQQRVEVRKKISGLSALIVPVKTRRIASTLMLRLFGSKTRLAPTIIGGRSTTDTGLTISVPLSTNLGLT